MTAVVTSSGAVIDIAPWTPTQITASGTPALAANSVPLDMWTGRVASFDTLYRSQPWVHITVNKICRQIARLPLKVYQRDSQGNRERVRDGHLVDLLASPTGNRGRMASIDVKQWILRDALVHGNSLMVKDRADGPGGPPTALWPQAWPSVTLVRSSDGSPQAWRIRNGAGRDVIRDFADTVHTSWYTAPDGLGVSPLHALGVTLGIEAAAQRHQTAILRNGARPSAAVTMDKDFIGVGTPEQRAEIIGNLRQDVDRLYAGPDNSGRPVLLPPGLSWNATSHTAVEAELIDQRRLSREEVAAVYDIPPPMIGILDHATYSNVTEMHRMLFTTVLGPWITLVEETLMAQLVRGEPAFEGQFIEFDLAEVLRGDILSELQALRLAVTGGIMTINEARRVRNLPPVAHPLADEPLVPTNNAGTLDELAGLQAVDPPTLNGHAGASLDALLTA